jgi:sterol desaturase/sphingolipid hydroxylase (fatty acid hydroxylase superfamily)
MFDSELLDKLSRVHPAVPVVIYVPEIAVLLALAIDAGGASALGMLGLFAGGYLLWTLSEYWIHRVIFHFEPEEGFGARLHWIIHGVHHDHPNDPLRLVMPPSVSLPLSSLFLVAFWAVLGTPLWYSFGAGFIAGYLIYDMTHYHLHHHKPKTRMGKRLRELHMRHHFQDDTTGFGISAPYWDSAFGTHSPKAKKAE